MGSEIKEHMSMNRYHNNSLQKQKGDVGKIDMRNVKSINEALESMTKFSHYIHDGSRWIKQRIEDHPRVNGLLLMVDKSGYTELGIDIPKNV